MRRRSPAGGIALIGFVACTVLASCLALLVVSADLVAGSVGIENTLGPLRTLSQRSTVYAQDGTTVLGRLGLEDRQAVPLSHVPKVLIDAVVDTEDATFFTNPGIDVAAMARSAITDLESGSVREGGSTITQQLAKNRLLTSKRDLHRKLREMSLAIQLNERYSKRRILKEYLNTVYFGQGAYGVASAAERFFTVVDPVTGQPRGKHLNELTLAEAALLAGVISSPEATNPFSSPERASARRVEVLERMLGRKSITRGQAYDAAITPLPSIPPPLDLRPRDYFVEDVQRQLLSDPRLGATPQARRDVVLRGGLKIYSTLDTVAQQQAQQAVADVLPDAPPFTAALVAMDPATGAVRALVGGPDYQTFQYNLVTHLPGRQAGSTYKIITLAAALEAGYSPNDLLNGTSPCTVVHPPLPPWDTENAEPGGGQLTLREATAESVNCAFAHLIASLGPQPVVDMAHRLGITQNVPAYLSITLGTNETTPLEMVTVASTLANRGVRHTPIFVSKVVDADGNVILDDSARSGMRVLSSDIADCETDILRGVVDHGTGTRAAIAGHDVAGKTGTTDNKADAWFVGFSPRLATAVWMGATTGAVPMTNVGGITVFGGTYPARIWHQFMDAQLSDGPNAPFSPPGTTCNAPGVVITDAGRSTQPAYRRGPASNDSQEPRNRTPAPTPSPAAQPSATQPPATQPPPTTAPAPAPGPPARGGGGPPGHNR